MTPTAKVTDIERKLCTVHQADPYLAMLVIQLASIAKSALAAAEANWPRHDKRLTKRREPDLFA